MKQKRDDGVSNVVAVMLILSIVVIGVTVFLGTYLPDMKETSEMQNSEDIRGNFMNYASAVDSLYSTHQAGQTSWTMNLGAGDVIISPSKSSGILELKPKEEFVTVSADPVIMDSLTCYSVDVEYSPTITYWRNIGYLYSRGAVTVTNPSADTAYFTLSEASRYGYSYDAATQTLTLIDWELGENTSKSGSGPATLTLKTERDLTNSRTYTITEATTVTVTSAAAGGSTAINLEKDTTLTVIVLKATVSIL